MKVFAIEVERDQGGSCCGTASFAMRAREGKFLWTVELRPENPSREIRVEVFPCEACDEELLAQSEGVIVERILTSLSLRVRPLACNRC